MRRSLLFANSSVLALAVTFYSGSIASAEDSNRNSVRAALEQGSWTVIWGKNFTEADWARGTAAIAESVAADNPGPFLAWFEQTLDENFSKIERNLQNVSRDELKRWISQSLKKKQVVTYKGLKIEAGFATYDRWNRVVYDEPRTRKVKKPLPLGGWTWGVEAYTERVEKKINLPNWHQFYIRYQLAPGNQSSTSSTTGGSGAADQMIKYTLKNKTKGPVTVSYIPSGNSTRLAPGQTTTAHSPMHNGEYPKVKVTTSSGKGWERTIRNKNGAYEIVDREGGKIQIVP